MNSVVLHVKKLFYYPCSSYKILKLSPSFILLHFIFGILKLRLINDCLEIVIGKLEIK